MIHRHLLLLVLLQLVKNGQADRCSDGKEVKVKSFQEKILGTGGVRLEGTFGE